MPYYIVNTEFWLCVLLPNHDSLFLSNLSNLKSITTLSFYSNNYISLGIYLCFHQDFRANFTQKLKTYSNYIGRILKYFINCNKYENNLSIDESNNLIISIQDSYKKSIYLPKDVNPTKRFKL